MAPAPQARAGRRFDALAARSTRRRVRSSADFRRPRRALRCRPAFARGAENSQAECDGRCGGCRGWRRGRRRRPRPRGNAPIVNSSSTSRRILAAATRRPSADDRCRNGGTVVVVAIDRRRSRPTRSRAGRPRLGARREPRRSSACAKWARRRVRSGVRRLTYTLIFLGKVPAPATWWRTPSGQTGLHALAPW